MGDARHLPVPAQRHHEVGLRLLQHPDVVGEDLGVADLGRALAGERAVAVLHRDQRHVGHLDQMPEVRGIEE